MAIKTQTHIHIGTSGWSYQHWDEAFYPEKLPPADRLSYYAHFFSIVEINSTFYNLPLEKTVSNWFLKTPENFIFSVKASRYITHLKRLKDPKESIDTFINRMRLLKEKLGPILFQLPPSFKADLSRLEEFLYFLPKDLLYVFEFRHQSWYTDSLYDLLTQNKIALCISDLNGELTPPEITTTFAYLRLHGPRKAYKGSYSPLQLKVWAKQFESWKADGRSVYCFFDNDEKGYAIEDALRIKKLLRLNH